MGAPVWWVSTSELFTKRPGVPFDAGGDREYVRRFRVIVNDKTVDAGLVCYAPLLPSPFQIYTNAALTKVDTLAVVVRLSAEPEYDDDWQNWIVTVNYSTKLRRGAGTSGKPESQGPNKPEDEFPEVDWDSQVEAVALQQDLDGNAIVNSANDPFQPAPTRQEGCPVLTVTRNEPSWSKKQQAKYAFVVNKDVFMGDQAGKCLMFPPKARKVYKGVLQYWKVTYRVAFLNPLELGKVTWQLRLLDCGLRQLALVNIGTIALPNFFKLPVPICENGHIIAHPALLDGNGQKARRNNQGKVQPVWLDFRVLRNEDFGPLKLDQYV